MSSGGGAEPSAVERLEALLRDLEAGEEGPALERARALAQGILEVHREGLERALALLPRESAGALAADALVSSLLQLHGLHPVPLEERARAAVERVPGARLVSCEEGAVRAVVRRASDREAVLAALEGAAGDAASIEVEAPPEGFVPLERLGAAKR